MEARKARNQAFITWDGVMVVMKIVRMLEMMVVEFSNIQVWSCHLELGPLAGGGEPGGER